MGAAARIVASIGLTIGITAPAASQSYTIINPPTSTNTYPLSINADGDIVGHFTDSNGVEHGFIRDHTTGAYSSLDGPSARATYALSISGNETTGFYYVEGDQNHGFVRDENGEFTTFDPPGSSSTDPMSIANGWIAGWYDDSAGKPTGFLRTRQGKIISFSVSGALGTTGMSVNSSGFVTGTFVDSDNNTHGFIRDPHTKAITTFDAPRSSDFTAPANITKEGKIAGSVGSDGKFVFVRSAAGKFKLIKVPGGRTKPYSAASGLITGTTAQHHNWHSFIIDESGTTTLFDPPGALGSFGHGINASGSVVGYYYQSGEGYQGYLRSP